MVESPLSVRGPLVSACFLLLFVRQKYWRETHLLDPLPSGIGQLLTLYCPGGRQVLGCQSGEGPLKLLHTLPRVTNIQLTDLKIKKKASVNDGILLLLPRPATSCYTLLLCCHAATTTGGCSICSGAILLLVVVGILLLLLLVVDIVLPLLISCCSFSKSPLTRLQHSHRWLVVVLPPPTSKDEDHVILIHLHRPPPPCSRHLTNGTIVSCHFVVPPVAIVVPHVALQPLVVVLPPVSVLPLAVVVPPVAVIVPPVALLPLDVVLLPVSMLPLAVVVPTVTVLPLADAIPPGNGSICRQPPSPTFPSCCHDSLVPATPVNGWLLCSLHTQSCILTEPPC